MEKIHVPPDNLNKQALQIEQALKLIPDWDIAKIEMIQQLGNGPSNHTYLIGYKSKKYVLRIDKAFTKKYLLHRKNEVEIHHFFAKLDLSPPIIFFEPEHGVLLREHLAGRAWAEHDLKNKDQLKRLAAVLRKLHTHAPEVSQYDISAWINQYKNDLATPQTTLWANEALTLLSEMSARPQVLCHNDLLPKNIIETDVAGEKRLWFIDLEYSGLGNPLFDVSTIINHQLSDDLSEHFLKAYFGEVDSTIRTDLELQGKVNDRLLALWYSVLIKNDRDDEESKLLLKDVKEKLS